MQACGVDIYSGSGLEGSFGLEGGGQGSGSVNGRQAARIERMEMDVSEGVSADL